MNSLFYLQYYNTILSNCVTVKNKRVKSAELLAVTGSPTGKVEKDNSPKV